jgi:hypothetical protein
MESITNEQYNNLRSVIISLNEKYIKAYECENEEESIKLYQDIFGDKFSSETHNDIKKFLTYNNTNRPFGGIYNALV